MLNYFDEDAELKLTHAGRQHPWTTSNHESPGQYYDFKFEPSRIRTSLEDFKPWEGYQAVQVFYELLEWLNGPDSCFESNDCTLGKLHRNLSRNIAKKELEILGRLMVINRELFRNDQFSVGRNLICLESLLCQLDPEFKLGCISWCRLPTLFSSLIGTQHSAEGYAIVIKWWSWGDSEVEVMQNLMRTFQNLKIALKQLSAKVLDV